MPTPDSTADSEFGGGRNVDRRDDVPTLHTCCTAGRDEAALRAPPRGVSTPRRE